MRSFTFICLAAPLIGTAQAPPWEWVLTQRGITSELVADDMGHCYALLSVYEQDELLGVPGAYSGEYIVKLDAVGQPLWTMQCEGCGIGRLVHERGYLYMAGEGWGEFSLGEMTVEGDTLSPTYFVAKMSLDGNAEWLFTANSTNNIQTGDISVNANEEVFIAGSGYGDVVVNGDTILDQMGNAQAYFWKLGPDGTFQWLRAGGCAISAKTRAKGAAYDRNGNFYATGFTGADPEWCDATPFGALSIPVEANFFLVKLSNDGALEWVRWAHGVYPYDLECMDDSKLVICGVAYDPATFEGQPWFTAGNGNGSAVVAGFDMDGEPAWSTFSQGGNAYAYRLAIDSTSIWAAVDCDGPFEIGQNIQLDTANFTMVMNLSPLGDPNWIAQLNSEYGVSCMIESTGFALGSNGAAYTSGYMLSQDQVGCTLDWQSGSATVEGEENPFWTYFIAKLRSIEVGLDDPLANRGFSTFPNPCSDEINVILDCPTGAIARIWTPDGRLVLTERSSSRTNAIRTDTFQSGYYILEAECAGERYAVPFVIQH